LLRRWRLAGTALSGVACFGLVFGPALVPAPEPQVTGQRLTVMSYNMLASNREIARVLDAVRTSGADVVGVQELSPAAARAFERELRELYPYQLLSADGTVDGMGVLSKWPIREVGTLPGEGWVGAPQIVDVAFGAQSVRLINFHAIPPLGSSSGIEAKMRVREQQMQQIADAARTAALPVIAVGDMNTPPGSGAHRIVTSVLTDAWEARGASFGHTWPSSRGLRERPNAIFGVTLPYFFVRIDYVLHSPAFTTVAVRQGPVFTGSDHRAVIAELALTA
jgi:vancomycin resistance protein VanJ